VLIPSLAEVKKANLSAAEALKAELAASMVGDDDEGSAADADKLVETPAGLEATEAEPQFEMEEASLDAENGVDNGDAPVETPRGKKRKINETGDEEDEEDEEDEAPPNPDADQPIPKKKLKVNANGTVDYEDEVK
jgi:5'-3' exoribonuclease 2